MTAPIHHQHESTSNTARDAVARLEPKTLRTFTPSQAILARSAGVFHWTPEGRRLFDFTSGVLVANLGHNPESWMTRFTEHMGWRAHAAGMAPPAPMGFFSSLPMTAYNAATPVEIRASQTLLKVLQATPGGSRLQQVLWAASGSKRFRKLSGQRWRAMPVVTSFSPRVSVSTARRDWRGQSQVAKPIMIAIPECALSVFREKNARM
jgi:hypothetical protein